MPEKDARNLPWIREGLEKDFIRGYRGFGGDVGAHRLIPRLAHKLGWSCKVFLLADFEAAEPLMMR